MRSRIKSGETFDYTRDENRLGVYMCWLPLRQLARLKPINKVRLVQWKDANVGSHRSPCKDYTLLNRKYNGLETCKSLQSKTLTLADAHDKRSATIGQLMRIVQTANHLTPSEADSIRVSLV